MITLVIAPNSLAYFRILTGPDWKASRAVSAKSSMGTRLRLHNVWEHRTCTLRENLACIRMHLVRETFLSLYVYGLSHRWCANNRVIAKKEQVSQARKFFSLVIALSMSNKCRNKNVRYAWLHFNLLLPLLITYNDDGRVSAQYADNDAADNGHRVAGSHEGVR